MLSSPDVHPSVEKCSFVDVMIRANPNELVSMSVAVSQQHSLVFSGSRSIIGCFVPANTVAKDNSSIEIRHINADICHGQCILARPYARGQSPRFGEWISMAVIRGGSTPFVVRLKLIPE